MESNTEAIAILNDFLKLEAGDSVVREAKDGRILVDTGNSMPHRIKEPLFASAIYGGTVCEYRAYKLNHLQSEGAISEYTLRKGSVGQSDVYEVSGIKMEKLSEVIKAYPQYLSSQIKLLNTSDSSHIQRTKRSPGGRA